LNAHTNSIGELVAALPQRLFGNTVGTL